MPLLLTSIYNHTVLTTSSEQNLDATCLHHLTNLLQNTLLLNPSHCWILLLQQTLPVTSRGQNETSGIADKQSSLPEGTSGQAQHGLLTKQSFLSRILYQM